MGSNRGLHRLSARRVATAGAGFHADGGGLYLVVGKTGASASWIYRYRIQGRLRDMGLGSANTLTLAEARDRAAQARKVRAEGRDPLDVKREARPTSDRTWGKAVDEFINSIRSGWKNKAAQENQWRQSLEDYGPDFALPVQEVDTALVLGLLQKIWTDKTETASRLRSRIERIWSAEKVIGKVSGENPARWRGHLDALLPKPSKVTKVVHHPAMPYSDIPEFWKTLTDRDGTTRKALQFTILTAARTAEILGAQWDALDLEGGFWDRSAEEMKAGVGHTIPLSSAATAVLKEIPRDKPPFALSNNAMLKFLKEDLGLEHLTVHGFRSTFRDWAGETTHHAKEVIEHALAHRIRDKSEAAYARGTLIEKRRALMQDWADYCLSALN